MRLRAPPFISPIPIVFVAGGDPVQLGLIDSLNRPGGNVTGIHIFSAALEPKKLELLHQLLPKAAVFSALVNPTNPNAAFVSKELEAAARAMKVQLQIVHASTAPELDAVFAGWAKLRADGLIVTSEGFFDSQRERIVALSAQHSVAGIYPWREYVVAGGVMSYGSSLPDAYRQAGIYVGRILNGEKPADLPVTQPTKFELVLNLRTAKALGVTIPATMLATADEVIE
jgi:putative tryptophan/tyrosine transport system substrate-binding protein